MTSLSKDTLFYSIANWGRRIVSLVTAPVVIAYLSPKDYGYLSLVMTVGSFCSTLGLLAVADQGISRFFIDADTDTERGAYAASSILVSSSGVLVVSALVLTGAPLVEILFQDVENGLGFVILVSALCVGQSVLSVGGNMLKWTFQAPLFTKISIVQAAVGSGVIVFGIIFLGFRERGIILTTATASLIAGGCANFAVRHYYRFALVSKAKIKALLGYSWPLVGISVFSFFTRFLDRVFLGSMRSFSDLGVFSVSSTVAGFFELLVSGFLFAWGPYLLSTFRESWARQRYAQYFSIVTFIGLASITVLGLWAGPLVALIRSDAAYRQVGVFVPWIVSGTLLYYLGAYFAPGPGIKKKTYWKLLSFIIAAGGNGILNYLLIPRLGIVGAGIATTVSSLIAGVFSQIVSNKLYYVPNKWKRSFAMIVATASAVSFIEHRQLCDIAQNGFAMRMLFTGGLCVTALVVYFKDIADSGVVGTIVCKCLGKSG